MPKPFLGLIIGLLTAFPLWAGLPWSTLFQGEEKFQALVARAEREDWRALPFGERVATVGLALRTTPYKNYTLEIDDQIEAPSVNFNAMDCWTFFEISLAFARMLESTEQTPQKLLQLIEQDRYLGGKCDGYLSRLHFLEQWSRDNEQRGLVRDVTRELGGTRMPHREIREMTVMWRSYRYLRANRRLIPQMAALQSAVSQLPVYHVPKSRVRSVESKIQTGDIICITTTEEGAYTTHVGLAYRDQNGTLRFLHATSSYDKGRCVHLDQRLSVYLADSAKRAGVMVVRPLPLAPSTPHNN